MQAPTATQKPKFGPTARGVNPFAQALAERERDNPNPAKSSDKFGGKDNNMFSQALANSGGGGSAPDYDRREQERQQAEAERKQKYEVQRRKLHNQVNPVDMVDVFSAREERIKKEIDSIRHELKMLANEVSKFHMDIDVVLNQEVVNPGQEGKYYISFFQQLRQFIMLLRQRIRSAQTWANQMHNKKSKKKHSKFSAGIDMAGEAHEQTKSAHDMMHHENNMVYGG
jgi:hypothetical protein